ncbi:putative Ig domain-containing protein [Gallaecimonas sp. GXIMD4217]|uniref:putative Ig domain-containing protein n=1 Tax=Gallaecimonas sp. GXIMD4217 TaxID=3131927 RepID=UPI00311AD871
MIVNPNSAPIVDEQPADTSISEDVAMPPLALGTVFRDNEGQDFTLAVTGLPAGVSFDSASQSLLGTATTPGVYTVTLTATDTAGDSAATAFNLTVLNSNDVPVAVLPLEAQHMDILDGPGTYGVNPNAFGDQDIDQGQDEQLSYSATLAGGAALPAFISFNGATINFTFTQSWYDIGTYTVELTATDKVGTQASQTFEVTVTGTNTMPMKHHWHDFAINEGEKRFFVHDDLHFMDAEQHYADVTFTLTRLPEHGSLLKDGQPLAIGSSFSQQDIEDENVLEYQHDGSETTEDGFHFYVDDQYGGRTPEYTDYRIVITPQNDAPMVSAGISDQVMTTGMSVDFVIPANAFSDAENDALSYSLSGLPGWASFDGLSITGIPEADDVAESIIWITADDGSGSTAATSFQLSVLLDSDVDGIPDVTDLDDDGDGMSDDWEQQHGLDPLDPADGDQDSDGDGLSNLEEFQAGLDPNVDDVAPVVVAPADLRIDAQALFTHVDLNMLKQGTASAKDPGQDVALVVSAKGVPSDGLKLRPGRHVITWIATDAAGNVGRAEQVVDIYPTISFGKDGVVSEGQEAAFKVVLNGNSPVYPVMVDYQVAGSADAQDHDLVSGSVTIEAGVEVTVSFTTLADAEPEGEEHVELSFVGEQNWGIKKNQVTRIVEGNLAPELSLVAQQEHELVTTVYQDGGLVELVVDIQDNGDVHDIQWLLPEGVSAEISEDSLSLVLDAGLLEVGLHSFQVVVTDDGEPALSADVSLMLKVVATSPELDSATDSDGDGINDQQEGLGDSDSDGIPNYLDNMIERHVLPERGGVTDAYIIEADAGVKLTLGELALAGAHDGAEVSSDDFEYVQIIKDEVPNVGGYFDFIAAELPEAGQSVNVVLPQREPIPDRAIYRKYLPAIGWQNFVEDTGNKLSSALGEQGYCPAPGSEQYRDGLTEGDWCVQLTIQDGGANDADGQANGVVHDPGGVGQPLMQEAEVTTSGSGGGSFGLLLALSLVTALYRLGRRIAVLLPLLVVSFSAAAFDLKPIYLQVGAGQGESSIERHEVAAELARVSETAVVTDFDAKDDSYWLEVGYRFDSGLALELGYVDLGQVSLTFTDQLSQLDVPGFLDKVAFSHPDTAEGFTLATSYQWPLSQHLSLSARLGLLRWDADYSAVLKVEAEPFSRRSESHNGTDWLFGVGAQYHLSEHWSLGLAYRVYYVDSTHIDILGLTLGYRF